LLFYKKLKKIRDERAKKSLYDPQKSLESKERGNKLFQEGKIPEAIKEYTEAIARNPNDHVPYSNRAACYTKLGEYPLAVKDANECIKMKPDFVKGYTRKGHAHFFLKEYEQALKAYDDGLKLEENNQELLDSVKRTIAEMNQATTGETEAQTRERAMKDPEVQEILSDPIMRQILEDMQSDPKAAQEHLKNPAVMKKIQKLMRAGVLRMG